MKKIIELIKKQKIFIFLGLILLVLIILKLSFKKTKKAEKQIQPPTLERKKEFIIPEKKIEPEKEPSSPAPEKKKEEKTSKEEGLEIPYDPAGEALKEALRERPWLLDLPIKEKNYTIDYLESKQSFRVLMKIDITSPLSREDQISNIKTEAPQKLEEIGVNLNQEKIYYTFTP